MRIRPRDRKGDAKTFEWHGVHNTFQSPTALKQKLKETFGIDKLPGNIEDLQIGYIAKRGNGKRWIDQDADLSSMYAQFEQSKSITLFCEVRADSCAQTPSRKRKCSYADHEDEIEKLAIELGKKHGEKYNDKQLTLWARMIVNQQHSDMETPPNIPVITGGLQVKHKKETLTEALASAATALTKALTPKSQMSPPTTPKSAGRVPGVSPVSKAKISTQYISQLKSLQDLRECGVLSETEFEEQKMYALHSIRRLNSQRTADD